MNTRLPFDALLKLKRWSTPTVYNGWEAITKRDRLQGLFNRESTTDYMPQMGAMVGYAITLVCQPGNPDPIQRDPELWTKYRKFLATVPGPKIIVVQDLDRPSVGAFWGEVTSTFHRAFGCVGTITDGAIRDVEEMTNAGFKALARQTCVGHAYSCPLRWDCEVEVFGCPVRPGDLIHADHHGFLIIPEEDQERLLEAVAFMDANECETLIAASRNTSGQSADEILRMIDEATKRFKRSAREHFSDA